MFLAASSLSTAGSNNLWLAFQLPEFLSATHSVLPQTLSMASVCIVLAYWEVICWSWQLWSFWWVLSSLWLLTLTSYNHQTKKRWSLQVRSVPCRLFRWIQVNTVFGLVDLAICYIFPVSSWCFESGGCCLISDRSWATYREGRMHSHLVSCLTTRDFGQGWRPPSLNINLL